MRKQLKDFFVPHEGNDYKPHSLQRVAMLGMLVLVVLSFTLANLQSLIWLSSDWLVSTILPAVIVDLTNDERALEDLGDLRRSEVLDHAAQLKAEDMAKNQYFAHYSPDGVSPWYWFNEVQYNFVHAGENLAIHFTDSGEVVDAWMNSPTHRANIMNGNFTEIGIGTASGYFEGFKTVYVVQLFGTPAVPEVVIAEETPVIAIAEEENSSALSTETNEIGQNTEQVITNPQISGSRETVEEVDDTTVVLQSSRDPIAVVPTSTKEESTTTEISEVATTEHSVILYSDHISTSTGGIPARMDTTTIAGSTSESAGMAGVLTRPQLVLQVLYTVIALFVVVALALALFIEIRRQHPIQVAYSAGLSAVMFALFYLHVALTGGALIM